MLSYQSSLVPKGSTNNKTRIRTIELTEHVSLVGVRLVSNAKDGAYASYYNDNLRFDHIGGSQLFGPSAEILDALNFFDLYELAQHMGSDPVLTAVPFYRCS